jgi:N6-L-threonylcarbamoyladenine synthase
MPVTILGIESSCDDTSASIVRDAYEVSNITASQGVHEAYGGVVPELASRAHQKNIVPVVDYALKQANVDKSSLDAVAFTQGPGLLGSLLVGGAFAKGFSLSTGLPLIGVNHLKAHVLAHFIKKEGEARKHPVFPFICLLVSGGHTQLIVVKDYYNMEIIGQTIDDAAGEAFDKCAKILGLPYPGGPHIDNLAKKGDPKAFLFSKPVIKGYDYSFSGLKTSFLYFVRDQLKKDNDFIEKHKADLCASLQKTIIDILLKKLIMVSKETGIKEIAIGGGVAANSGLKNALIEAQEKQQWNVFIPEFKYTMDNAAMIAITGYYKYLKSDFAGMDVEPMARMLF